MADAIFEHPRLVATGRVPPMSVPGTLTDTIAARAKMNNPLEARQVIADA